MPHTAGFDIVAAPVTIEAVRLCKIRFLGSLSPIPTCPKFINLGAGSTDRLPGTGVTLGTAVAVAVAVSVGVAVGGNIDGSMLIVEVAVAVGVWAIAEEVLLAVAVGVSGGSCAKATVFETNRTRSDETTAIAEVQERLEECMWNSPLDAWLEVEANGFGSETDVGYS